MSPIFRSYCAGLAELVAFEDVGTFVSEDALSSSPSRGGGVGMLERDITKAGRVSGHDPVQDACAGEINDGARPVANKGARPELVNADVRCICTKMLVGEFWSIIKTPRADWQEIGRPRRRTRKNQGPC